MRRHIALFVGLVFLTLATLSAVNFVKADPQEVFKSTGLSVIITTAAGTESTSAALATATTGTSTGRFMRLVWLSGATGYVGFSCGTYGTGCLTATTQSATALTSPMFISDQGTDMIVDAGRDAPLLHVISLDGVLSILVETVDRVQ